VTIAVEMSFAECVTAAIDELRVAMEPDGGGVEIVDVTDHAVTLRLVGSCLFCPSRALSAEALRRRLTARLHDVSHVHFVHALSESAQCQ